MVEKNTKRDRRGKQINFEAPELVEPLREISERTGITQTIIARVAIREKLHEISEKLEKGEEVALTI